MNHKERSLIEKLNKKYTENFKKHGFSKSSVGWSSDKTDERYKLLFRGLDNYNTILDIGCGLGHLLLYLKQNKFDIKYSGSEINPTFYNYCKESYKNSNFYLQKGIKLLINKKFDVVVMSGLFNTCIDNSSLPFKSLIDNAFQLSCKYITFNFLSQDVDFKDSHLNYTSLGEVIEFCESRSEEIIIKKSRLLHEVTVSIRIKSE